MGPFRVRSYVPGERLVLERNPHYWKADAGGRAAALPRRGRLPARPQRGRRGHPLQGRRDRPHQPSERRQLRRAGPGRGGRDATGSRISAPGSSTASCFFNLNTAGKLDGVSRKQAWFRQQAFRRAVSAALDRKGIARLVYQGRATPLGTHVTPGNKLWVNETLAAPARSPARARELLTAAGFSWNAAGALLDPAGAPVDFTIVTNAGNATRVKIATVVEDDLRQLGMRAQLVPIDNRALLDRVFESHDYEAAVMALGSGDVDPNSEMNVWLSSGPTHLWHLGQPAPATAWEKEIDDLMRRQLVTLDPRERKRLYDRVQALVAENLPLIPLVSPNLLVGARTGLGNFRPAILDHYVLWNADELFWEATAVARP